MSGQWRKSQYAYPCHHGPLPGLPDIGRQEGGLPRHAQCLPKLPPPQTTTHLPHRGRKGREERLLFPVQRREGRGITCLPATVVYLGGYDLPLIPPLPLLQRKEAGGAWRQEGRSGSHAT